MSAIFEKLFEVRFDGRAFDDRGARFRRRFGVHSFDCRLQFGQFCVFYAVIFERGFVFRAEIVNRPAAGGEFAVFDAVDRSLSEKSAACFKTAFLVFDA